MKKTGNPLALTINGKAKVVVQDAEAYQERGIASRPRRAFGKGWPTRRPAAPSQLEVFSTDCGASMAYRVEGANL
jgi:hypothetical protein